MGILELTVCDETNFVSSRNYKMNKYKNIGNHKSQLIENADVSVSTCEISVLGFIIIEPKFLQDWGLPPLDNKICSEITKCAVSSSFEIYVQRNM